MGEWRGGDSDVVLEGGGWGLSTFSAVHKTLSRLILI